MAESWFDKVRQETEAAAAASVLEDEDNTSKDSQEEAPRRSNRPAPTRPRLNWTVGLVGAAGTVLVVAGAATFWLVNSEGGQAPAELAADVELSVPPTTTGPVVPPEELVGVAGQCEPEVSETVVDGADRTLRGAVARYQAAYYAMDAEGLTTELTESSWMQDQDWAEILPTAGVDGASWCAVMAPQENESVNVDLMVTFPDGSDQLYPQTVIGQEIGDKWAIEDIVVREG